MDGRDAMKAVGLLVATGAGLNAAKAEFCCEPTKDEKRDRRFGIYRYQSAS